MRSSFGESRNAGGQRKDLWSMLLVLMGSIAVVSAGCHRQVATPAPTEEDTREYDAAVTLAERFADLKNAGSPEAEELLGPAPVIPAEPVTAGEAARLDAEFLLRSPVKIVDVRLADGAGPKRPGPPRLLLVSRGAIPSPSMKVRTGDTVDRLQKVFSNPNIVVEVKEEKIHGVGVQVNVD